MDPPFRRYSSIGEKSGIEIVYLKKKRRIDTIV